MVAWARPQQPGLDGFQWLLDGSQIAGATAQTLTLPGADVGHAVVV